MLDIKKYNKDKGNEGEEYACDYLKKNNYEILKRNYTTKLGEIDMIARKDNSLFFIEVKLRDGIKYGHGVEAVDKYKQIHILNTAKQFIAYNNIKNMEISFDVIEITKFKDKYYGKHYRKMIG